MANDAYAGVRRRKQTPWRVKFGDALVSRLITVGGIATIGAVLLVVIVLLATAMPLWRRPSASNWHTIKLIDGKPAGDSADAPSPAITLACGSDEFGLMVWQVDASGAIRIHSAFDGQLIDQMASPADQQRSVTCYALSIDRTQLTLGFSDGSFQNGSLVFQSSLLTREQLPPEVSLSADHPVVLHEKSLYQLFGDDAIRVLSVQPVTWSKPEKVSSAALQAIDFLSGDATNQFSQAASSTLVTFSDQKLIVATLEARENMLTGEVTHAVTSKHCAAEVRSQQPPLKLMLTSRAAQAIVAWDTGTLDRYALQAGGPKFMESVSGLPGKDRFTAATAMIARQTLLLGDAAGGLQGWNVVQQSTDPAESTPESRSGSQSSGSSTVTDGYRLVQAHELRVSSSPIRSLCSSSASHLALVGSEDNRLALVMTTTDSLLKQFDPTRATDGDVQLQQAFLTPKNDVLVALSGQQLTTANLDVAFPEATWRGFFGRVWYEGHDRPKYIWQSSAGTEQSEPKLSLVPLVFGTLKATLYAMIFSVPLALLAAIYTSEFLAPHVRSRIKPMIELMASLPSVILGFIAALVLAPLMQQNLCAILLSIFIVPATFVFVAHFWNLLPLEVLVRAQHWRLWFLLACIPLGLSISFGIAPLVENWLFAGNVVQWMSGTIGTATGGWMLLLIPGMVGLAVYLTLGPLAERNRLIAVNMTPRAFAIRGVVQLLIIASLVVAASYGISQCLSVAGFDLRKSLFTGYQERNSLLVGAVLGFCIIPLIYTLADDALQSVPQQLRSASLGCGATPWQTTVRVVVPSAMSGMFSAIMIGFGRAVGETMVVLMAAGNTPIMEWNPFNGFRTLSATLATELPEAAKGSAHFRTLFLAALLLFTLTLIANTVAEVVRIRFRRRGSQL